MTPSAGYPSRKLSLGTVSPFLILGGGGGEKVRSSKRTFCKCFFVASPHGSWPKPFLCEGMLSGGFCCGWFGRLCQLEIRNIQIRNLGCANTQPFLCNALGPFQIISGNLLETISGNSSDFKQFPAISDKFRPQGSRRLGLRGKWALTETDDDPSARRLLCSLLLRPISPIRISFPPPLVS